MNFGLERKYIDFIKNTLSKNIDDKNIKIYVFGSRAKGKYKEYSDVDIALELKNKKLSKEVLDKIKIEFDNSLLPYEVDIIDLNSINENFKNLIKPSLIELK